MTLPPVSEELLRNAEAIMIEAGKITLKWFNNPELAVDFKHDGTPVTEADIATETFIRDRISSLYPDDAIIGEEHGSTTGSSTRTWIVDPIDGTKAFSRGVALYSGLLSVEDEHGPAVSVITLPALGETVVAGRGRGCLWNGRPCQVSQTTQLSNSVLTTTGFDYWPENELQAVFNSGVHMRTWGDGYGYALVATGRAEVMVDPIVSHWDIAPMPLLLSEAGGMFTALDGREGSIHGSGIATNGLLHQQMVTLIGR